MIDPITCPWCLGLGRRSSADVTLGFEWSCHDCAGTGRVGEGIATASELATLQAEAYAAGLDAAALRRISLSEFGEIPNRLRQRHVEGLIAAIGDLAEAARRAAWAGR